MLATRGKYARIAALPPHADAPILFTAMTALEFIRKNSILVLIVIAAVALGLVMMDYSGKGSMFSNDYYIQVNGTGYDYAETEMLGGNGREYLSSLVSSVHQRIQDNFDADGNEELDDAERQKANAWVEANPHVEESLALIQLAYQTWGRGVTEDDSVNFAISRAMLHEQAKEFGIKPSKEQVDAFIRSFPSFVKADGNFDQSLYQRLAGYRNGVANNNQERAFRAVIEDLIIWQSLRAMLTEGVSFNRTATADLINAMSQKMLGKTAWLPLGFVTEPAEPTEEELKTYWESHKENYKSEEKRIISIYTLTPTEGTTLDALLSTADIIMQDLSQANGQGFDQMLETAAENPELSPFSYLTAEGKSHITLPLSALSSLPTELQVEVDHNGETVTLGQAAFTVETAPSVQEYEAATAAGTADKLVNIKHVRGFFPTKDGKLALVRVEAAEAPVVLPYEEARERALADLRQERKDNALELRAKEIYAAMEAVLAEGGDITSAFNKAEEMGAVVSTFGPVGLGLDDGLPEGADPAVLMRTPSGKLIPLVVMPHGARISSVIDRTVEDSPEMRGMRDIFYLRQMNSQLELYTFLDWHSDAIRRYNVQLSKYIKTAGSDPVSAE